MIVMNNEELDELIEYNLEYLEARNSEDIFGGDYTSAVDLKYANKEIEQLQQENKQLKDNWNELKEYCKNHYYGITTIGVLEKMQELERGDSNE